MKERKVYFICVACRAGDHDRIMEDGHIEKQHNSFVLKPGEYAPIRKGDFIDFKNCPDCRKETLIKD